MSQSTFLKYGYFVVPLTINFLSLSVHAQAYTCISYELPAGMLELHAFIVTVQQNQSKNKPQARSTWIKKKKKARETIGTFPAFWFQICSAALKTKVEGMFKASWMISVPHPTQRSPLEGIPSSKFKSLNEMLPFCFVLFCFRFGVCVFYCGFLFCFGLLFLRKGTMLP